MAFCKKIEVIFTGLVFSNYSIVVLLNTNYDDLIVETVISDT